MQSPPQQRRGGRIKKKSRSILCAAGVVLVKFKQILLTNTTAAARSTEEAIAPVLRSPISPDIFPSTVRQFKRSVTTHTPSPLNHFPLRSKYCADQSRHPIS